MAVATSHYKWRIRLGRKDVWSASIWMMSNSKLARQAAAQSRRDHVEFRRLNVVDWYEESQYDCIYARFLLTHLADPLRVLRQMLQAVRPGGLAVVEDIDFGGYFCHPPCAGFDAYVRLYRTAAAAQGADADIGPKLHGLLHEAGCVTFK